MVTGGGGGDVAASMASKLLGCAEVVAPILLGAARAANSALLPAPDNEAAGGTLVAASAFAHLPHTL